MDSDYGVLLMTMLRDAGEEGLTTAVQNVRSSWSMMKTSDEKALRNFEKKALFGRKLLASVSETDIAAAEFTLHAKRAFDSLHAALRDEEIVNVLCTSRSGRRDALKDHSGMLSDRIDDFSMAHVRFVQMRMRRLQESLNLEQAKAKHAQEQRNLEREVNRRERLKLLERGSCGILSEPIGFQLPPHAVSRTAKMIILGAPQCGKTSLAMQYTEGSFPRRVKGLTIRKTSRFLRSRDTALYVQLDLWDVRAQPKHLELIQKELADCLGVILAFSVTDRDSADALEAWREVVVSHGCPSVKVFVVGCKTDAADRVVDKSEAELLAKQHGASGYFELSSKTGEGVVAAFNAMVAELPLPAPAVEERPGDKSDASAITVLLAPGDMGQKEEPCKSEPETAVPEPPGVIPQVGGGSARMGEGRRSSCEPHIACKTCSIQ